MRWVLGILIAALLTPTLAVADQADRFGSPNTIAPNGRLAFEMTQVQRPGQSNINVYSVETAPGMLYFVTRNLAIGGSLVGIFETSGSGNARVKSYSLGLAPEIGFNVPLSRTVSFFPTLGFLYQMTTNQTGTSEENKTRHTRGLLRIFAPLAFHFDNFFMGMGPFVGFDVISKARTGRLDAVNADKRLNIGVKSMLGGWF